MAVATLDLFKGVGDENGITVDIVKDFINANKSNELSFNIDTMGGSLYAALTIHNLIKLHPKKTTANIIGMTASAGTIIAAACDEVIMNDNVLFLIHNGMKSAYGNKYEMQSAIEDLEKSDKLMENIYAERTGLPVETIAELMKKGDWMTAEEAKQYGFVDVVRKSSQKIAASMVIKEMENLKFDNLLISNLKTKMNLFNKKTQVKAEVLPDGEYMLDNGTKIVVKGGVSEIVPVEETKKEEIPAEATVEQVVSEVTKVVNEAIANVKAEITAEMNAKLEAIVKATGEHKPAKNAIKGEMKGESTIEAAQKQVAELTAQLRKGLVESRKK